MRLRLFKSKLHRGTITQADLHYEGSLTIASDLMDAADILDFEEVHVWNVTNGARLATYAIRGPAGSGILCMNGAAAHHNRVGDLVIVATFCELEAAEARAHRPKVVLLDPDNRIVKQDHQERPGPEDPNGGEC